MTARSSELDRLSAQLWKNGVAGFCATTLSMPLGDLREAVIRLGRWIRAGSAPGALPLGIHLEGPYLNPSASGAHAPSAIRPFRLQELESLREASLDTIRIVTLAPELLSRAELRATCRWAERHRVRLSLGHSRATQNQADLAFRSGFTGVTHAWNAMSFHHRATGPLGAALGRNGIYVELIADGIHVSPTLMRWTCELHAAERTCFVSDCAPAAELPKKLVNFGNLKVRYAEGACRLPDGTLAGGGILLPEAFRRWLEAEAALRSPAGRLELLRKRLPGLSQAPLTYLGVPSAPKLRKPLVEWSFHGPRLKTGVCTE